MVIYRAGMLPPYFIRAYIIEHFHKPLGELLMGFKKVLTKVK
jgi:hypothetical protein